MEDLRKIANEKLSENRKFRAEMLALVASGESIAFIGAGLSAPLKFPPWPKLLEILTQEANTLGPFTPSEGARTDALRYAEEIQQHFESRGKLTQFKNILGREFAPKQTDNCTGTHQRVVKLPFRGFVTSNYEQCVEQALNEYAVAKGDKPRNDLCVIIKANAQDRHMVSNFLRSIVDPDAADRRQVAHIHGCYSDVENIILSESDYARAYGFTMEQGRIVKNAPISTLHRQLAWSLFACRRMVFFGCSMDDPYVKALLDAVSGDLWEWGLPIHFVVFPLDQKALDSVDSQVAYFKRYGVQVVFFDNWDGTYAGLDQLLDEAAQMERRPKGTPAAEPSKAPAVAPAKASPQSSDESVNLGWLEDVNANTAPSLKKNED